MIDNLITINGGDWQMIRELQKLWRVKLEEKFMLLERIAHTEVSSYARVEANTTLIQLTGEIKALDAKIHYLLTGEEIQAEVEPISLGEYFKLKYASEKRLNTYRYKLKLQAQEEAIEKLKRDIEKMQDDNCKLRITINSKLTQLYRYRRKLGEVGIATHKSKNFS